MGNWGLDVPDCVGIRFHRLPAAVGSEGVLGNGGWSKNCWHGSCHRGVCREGPPWWGGGRCGYAHSVLCAAHDLAAVARFWTSCRASVFVRYYGSAGTPKNAPEDMRSGKPFYPDQLFEDAVAILILFVILAAMAIFIPVPLEELADPTDASYDPRPEWYFLFFVSSCSKYF